MNSHCCWLYSTMSSIKSYSYPIKSPSTSLSKPIKYVKYPTSNPITYPIENSIKYPMKNPHIPSKLPSPHNEKRKTKRATQVVRPRASTGGSGVPGSWYHYTSAWFMRCRTSERGWMTGWPTNFFGEIEYGINTNRKLGKDLGNLGRLWEWSTRNWEIFLINQCESMWIMFFFL